ncbi:unnamed protein product [Taenia asiatica]|uniref:Uncharacterized protein n=1 Tax=Taenia asiatica TaxID=60517 RepID=A0A3P6NRX5_TAEAS|nr:unnamed protein product [Taenia asiatica]
MHPYFANLDKKPLPAVGEEYVGLPISRIPPDIAGLFNALINIDGSDLEGKDEEWMKEAEEIVSETPRMVPSTMLLGASTYQVSAARGKFAKEKMEETETEELQRSSDPKRPVTKPLAENHADNKSDAWPFIEEVVEQNCIQQLLLYGNQGKVCSLKCAQNGAHLPVSCELTEEASQPADLGEMTTPMSAPGVILEELIGKD